jgi:predicted glycogen debranching enzyme
MILHNLSQDWENSNVLEWIVTNGIGGYASSSIAGANTRRYHGLLVAACNPPLGRAVLLSKLEEELKIDDQIYHLSSNKFPNVIHPQGFRYLASVSSDPILTFTFNISDNGVTLQKQIWMGYQQNTVYVRYTLLKAPDLVQFSLQPFMTYKDYHTELRQWDGFTAKIEKKSPSSIEFKALDNAIPICLSVVSSDSFTYRDQPGWYFNYEHEREIERGQDAYEDLYCAGAFDGQLRQGDVVTFIATIESEEPASPHEALKKEIERKEQLVKKARVSKNAPDIVRDLILASDQFLIAKSKKVSRATVIAGYPWFTDWGRDTMISLPGLCLSTKRYESAKQILLSFGSSVKNGLLPNRFTDDGAGAEYNTVDATLWMFQAAYLYAKETGDWALLTDKLYEPFEAIIKQHIDGAPFNIQVDPEDGLLYAGQDGYALTWMDARTGDFVVTPRIGKPVEIQALWHNALRIFAEISDKADKPSKKYVSLAAKVKKSFKEKFISPDLKDSLLDIVDSPNRDGAKIRPNQLFALSLSFPILDPKSRTASKILKTVEEQLLTPKGLRTLAPDYPEYCGKYGPGDQGTRDLTYHQGTVWPWLFGAYVDASIAVRDEAPLRLIAEYAKVMLSEFGLGSIAEIYDGDSPHRPNGCIAQAWSVAEILRVLTRS